jgi:hypothetical protein
MKLSQCCQIIKSLINKSMEHRGSLSLIVVYTSTMSAVNFSPEEVEAKALSALSA